MSGEMVLFQDSVRQALSLGTRPRVAKADAQKPGIAVAAEVMRLKIARGLVLILGLFNGMKVAADELEVDASDLAKWTTGERRPQFDKLLAHPLTRTPTLFMLADLNPEVEVVKTIRHLGGAR